MRRVAFEPDDLGRDRNFVVRIFGNGQLHLAADQRQFARQIDQRALLPDIFGQPFLDDLLAVRVLPPDTDRIRDRVACAMTSFLHKFFSKKDRRKLPESLLNIPELRLKSLSKSEKNDTRNHLKTHQLHTE